MTLRIAILGPGRVGTALARRFREAGADVLGLLGRDAARTAAAVRWSGAGRVLDWRDLAGAHVVLFAVADPALPALVATAIERSAHRRCALWVHTSGRHGLDVFAPARGHGLRCGALHPVAPFADPAAGLTALAGAPALCEGDPRSERLLRRLAVLLGLVPVFVPGLDRARYHAACALAANGATALRGLVDEAFAAAGVWPDGAPRAFADALMGAALDGTGRRGAAAALSGPVRRGDAETVAVHLRALAESGPLLADVYRALAHAALRLAAAEGLAPAQQDAVRAVLDAPPAGGPWRS